jgi:hypothetical protein
VHDSDAKPPLAEAALKHPAATSSASTTPSPTPTPSSTPTLTPTAAPKAAAPANPPAAAPAAPVAAPAQPIAAGPGRTAPGPSVKVLSFTAAPPGTCPSKSSNNTFRVDITWNSSGGTSWHLTDQLNNLGYLSIGASGSHTVFQSCNVSVNGGLDTYTFSVSTTDATYSVKSASKSIVVSGNYPPGS